MSDFSNAAKRMAKKLLNIHKREDADGFTPDHSKSLSRMNKKGLLTFDSQIGHCYRHPSGKYHKERSYVAGFADEETTKKLFKHLAKSDKILIDTPISDKYDDYKNYPPVTRDILFTLEGDKFVTRGSLEIPKRVYNFEMKEAAGIKNVKRNQHLKYLQIYDSQFCRGALDKDGLWTAIENAL